jgi:hypothetical protein
MCVFYRVVRLFGLGWVWLRPKLVIRHKNPKTQTIKKFNVTRGEVGVFMILTYLKIKKTK